MKQTEQLRHDDKNLREAVRRNMAEAPLLPSEFSVHLQQRLQPAVTSRRRWHRMAAAIAALAVAGGLVWAIIPLLTSPRGIEQTEAQASPQRGPEGASMIYFSNTPLDSMLSVVGDHYGRAVCFHDGTLRRLRFTMTWDSVQTLSSFIDNVNEFEGLLLKDERDTIYVEPTGMEE